MATENVNEKIDLGINWEKLALRTPHGSIDVEGTLRIANEELTAVAAGEVSMDEIAGAVEKVFDKLMNLPNGSKALNGQLPLGEVAQRAVDFLDVAFGTTTQFQERVKNYVRGESEAFEASDGETGRYLVCRGKSGGIRLSTPSMVASYREAKAKKLAAAAK